MGAARWTRGIFRNAGEVYFFTQPHQGFTGLAFPRAAAEVVERSAEPFHRIVALPVLFVQRCQFEGHHGVAGALVKVLERSGSVRSGAGFANACLDLSPVGHEGAETRGVHEPSSNIVTAAAQHSKREIEKENGKESARTFGRPMIPRGPFLFSLFHFPIPIIAGMDAAERTRRVAEQARALGFDLCGVARAEKFPELEHLPEWLERGYAGEMRYVHNPKRQSPELVLPGARSVIACAMNYNTPLPYSLEARAQFQAAGDAERGWVSRYAWGDDYHAVLGERLEKLVTWMRSEFAEPHKSLAYVDTGPIVERVAAKWAGLGWLGKNTCLIHKDWGSWLFLGVVITTLELEPSLREERRKGKREKGEPATNKPGTEQEPGARQELPVTPAADLCGQCTLCIDACPTEALVEPYVLDARRCISYLTIELRGPIPEEFHGTAGWHIFGCDICQDVCPYNRKAPVTGRPEFLPRTTLFAPRLQEIAALAEESFEQAFSGSAIRRTKKSGLARNIALAGKRASEP